MKKMKKVMSLLLVMAMMTALVSGCANSGNSDAAGDTAAESTDAAAQAFSKAGGMLGIVSIGLIFVLIKNTNTIPVNPISKTIVSVPARNDIIPKYSVHDKNNIDIMICRILYPSFNDIMYFGSSSANILDFFFRSIYLIFPFNKISHLFHFFSWLLLRYPA